MNATRRFDAVICDIDGCLAAESNAPLNLTALAEIAAFNRLAEEREDRPRVTVCSGRPEPFVEAVCRVIANRTLPAIAENGVWLFDPATDTYERDPAITAADLEALHDATAWIEREYVPRGLVVQPGKSASFSLWHADTAFLFSQIDRLRELFEARGWPLRVSHTVAWINCDLKHVSKGTGLSRLRARAGLARERLAGIGDSASDLVMLDHVSFFACPSNAADSVRERANYISPFSEAEGALDILRRLADGAP